MARLDSRYTPRGADHVARRGVRGFSPAGLRTHRTRARLTLEDLADRAGVSVQALSAWERAVNSPGVKPLGAVAAALRISVSNLVPVPDGRLELDHLRVRAVLTQDEVAIALGVSATVVAKMERGRTPVNPVRAEELAQLYGTQVEDIAAAWDRTNQARKTRLDSM